MRFLFLVLGTLCVGLAVLGVILPVLPTTPFLLLAGGCYARGSERAHAWLLSNRLLGPTLRRWHEERTISVRAKTAAVGLMFLMMAVSAWLTRDPWLAAGMLVTFVAVSSYLLRIPSRREPPPPSASS